ncbi:hypothetical protein ACLMJK_008426 [Lecanora helva]
MATTVAISPHRKSPHVQALQSASPYTNIFTNSPLLLRDAPPTHATNTIRPSHYTEVTPNGYPEPRWRFEGSAGYGGRHKNDRAPFSLWDNVTHSFQNATKTQKNWIFDNYNATDIMFQYPFLIIVTDSPPSPVSLTVGCAPAIFIASEAPAHLDLYGKAPYVNPRLPDPLPHLTWPKYTNPTRDQIGEVVTTLNQLMNVKGVLFLPIHNVVELDSSDDRTYEPGSLPGIVGQRTTTYHHETEPFLQAMKNLQRERGNDPAMYAQWVDVQQDLPQDHTDYLANNGALTPGARVSSRFFTASGAPAPQIAATTAGVILRKGHQKRLTVANHGFLNSNEVYHPSHTKGNMLGTIDDRIEELDVALVKLNPAFEQRTSNNPYFQAETPRRLVGSDEIIQGQWYEVDGMATGLMSLLNFGKHAKCPVRPGGFPPFEFSQWQVNTINRLFGASNDRMRDGICGAPIAGIGTGDVAGFFHLANAEWAECATIDDLIALGWELA